MRPIAIFALLAVLAPGGAFAHGGVAAVEGTMLRYPEGGGDAAGTLSETDRDWIRVPWAGGPLAVAVSLSDGASAVRAALLGPGLDAPAEPLPSGVALAEGEGVAVLRAAGSGALVATVNASASSYHLLVWQDEGPRASYSALVGEDAGRARGFTYLREPADGEPASAVPDDELPLPWRVWVARYFLPISFVVAVIALFAHHRWETRRARKPPPRQL